MSIYTLFNELNARLAEIENHSFARTTGYAMGDYYQLLRNIEHQLDLFPISDSLPVINYYFERVNNSIEKIINEFPKEASEIKRPIEIVVIEEEVFGKAKSRKTRNIPDEIFILEELEYYGNRLSFMLEVREQFNTPSGKNVQPVIQLPEGFTVRHLKFHFQPILDSDQIALLLEYLKGQHLIPDFKKSSLSELAEPLFARSGQDIREALGNVHSPSIKNKKNLTVLKDCLIRILEEIEKDMKPSK